MGWRVGDACMALKLVDEVLGPFAYDQDSLGGVQDVKVIRWGWCMVLKWHRIIGVSVAIR